MVQISDSLCWELVKKNTSFMKKVNGRSRRSGTIQFSVEKGNVKSINSFKYSGLANSKTIDIASTADNRGMLSTKTKKAHNEVKKGQAATPLNKDFRRVEHTIKSQALDNYYRPDLSKDALAKWSAVYRANRYAKGIKKTLPMKKGRKTL
uniref:Ribosomal eL28/Mak16 domain-containing protein n=1 Tax=Ditylum brightwellii TaxID=49249 RepID=A0A6V2ABZ3_9STRA|mmetsp:Transcript_31019/g.41393  ORF Transcript_31019/g.41393 Transcript_31019/m.41393 type:complete len:150 (+) Transcript_31019:72-521(+)